MQSAGFSLTMVREPAFKLSFMPFVVNCGHRDVLAMINSPMHDKLACREGKESNSTSFAEPVPGAHGLRHRQSYN